MKDPYVLGDTLETHRGQQLLFLQLHWHFVFTAHFHCTPLLLPVASGCSLQHWGQALSEKLMQPVKGFLCMLLL